MIGLNLSWNQLLCRILYPPEGLTSYPEISVNVTVSLTARSKALSLCCSLLCIVSLGEKVVRLYRGRWIEIFLELGPHYTLELRALKKEITSI